MHFPAWTAQKLQFHLINEELLAYSSGYNLERGTNEPSRCSPPHQADQSSALLDLARERRPLQLMHVREYLASFDKRQALLRFEEGPIQTEGYAAETLSPETEGSIG